MNVRSLAIAAAVSVVGIVLMILASAFNWGSVGVTIGVLMAGVGLLVVVLAQEASRRASVTATLNDDAFILVSNKNRIALPWSDVRQVAMSANTLIVRDTAGREIKVLAPPGSESAELDSLAAAMAQRLDADRGYRNLT